MIHNTQNASGGEADRHHSLDNKETASGFSPMFQGVGTNRLAKVNSKKMKKNIVVEPMSNVGIYNEDNFKIIIEKYDKATSQLSVGAHKLLDVFTMALTAQNQYRTEGEINALVKVPLETYMKMCGIPLTASSKDETRKQVKIYLSALNSISLDWTEPGKKQARHFIHVGICANFYKISNGDIYFRYTPEMADYLIHAYVMYYPTKLLKIDGRNSASYYLGKKLAEHNSNNNNRAKGTSDIISVKCLLESCPIIPTYDEVIKTDKHLEDRIKRPFEKALDVLQENGIIQWEYCNGKKVPLSEEQLENGSYSVFSMLYVKFKIIGEEAIERPVQLPDKKNKKQSSTKTKKF